MGKLVDHARIKIGDLVTLEPHGCTTDVGIVVDTRLYECDVYWFENRWNPVREDYRHLVKLS
tara:strand:- start:415 stop:600 length:186 start_codon:yes stop_codon:yes gene_type:complete